jgi:aspartate 1-decarboxylase
MHRTLLNGKIHRCSVTSADLNYVGSITVDPLLLEAANMVPFEKVQVVNVNNGNRWETYAITGEPGDGCIQVNGGGARLVSIGDILIIMTYLQVPDPVPADWQPKVVMVDAKNRITEIFSMEQHGRAGVLPIPDDGMFSEDGFGAGASALVR